MFSKIISAIKKIVSIFVHKEPVETKPVLEVEHPTLPVEMPKPSEPSTSILTEQEELDWVAKAVEIIASFEGNGVDWGNPVGNFDGAYLTCGVIGFTWKYNNQPPMIKDFINRFGATKLMELMPRYGAAYMKAAQLGESGGASIVADWSGGRYTLPTAIRNELYAFWTSPGMITIQKERIMTMIGNWGLKKMYETQKYFNLPKPQFEHLVFWMDQATLNGTGKTPAFDEHKSVTFNEIMDFCRRQGGYNKDDLRRNGSLWSQTYPQSPAVEQAMFRLGYLRAIRSSSDFRGTVLNRRGTLALGKGYVNGSLRTYAWN